MRELFSPEWHSRTDATEIPTVSPLQSHFRSAFTVVVDWFWLHCCIDFVLAWNLIFPSFVVMIFTVASLRFFCRHSFFIHTDESESMSFQDNDQQNSLRLSWLLISRFDDHGGNTQWKVTWKNVRDTAVKGSSSHVVATFSPASIDLYIYNVYTIYKDNG